MKKILILFGEDRYEENDFFKKDIYKKSYEYLYKLAEKNGIKLFRASYKWYDQNSQAFSKALTFENEKWTWVSEFNPDLVYDKTEFSIDIHYQKKIIAQHYRIINDPDFAYVCNNKFLMSSLMPKFFKKYQKMINREELIKIASEIEGDKVVLKPIYGSGGENVQIIDKKDLEKVSFEGETIVQEFVDSSKGIEGIVEGVHDLRLVFISDELVYSYVRQPAPGSFLANLAQGGSMKIVEEIPSSVKEIIHDFQEIFSCYEPKIYTIDLIFDKNQKPWVVEINTMPGIYFSEDQNKWRDKMYLKLIGIFKKYAL